VPLKQPGISAELRRAHSLVYTNKGFLSRSMVGQGTEGEGTASSTCHKSVAFPKIFAK
jgi:hypothetical protein